MKISNRIIVILTIFFTTNIVVYSQSYRFLEYGTESGLNDNFIYNIIQDDNGYLWLGTGEGICRYDGIEFITAFSGDSLPLSPVKSSFKDSSSKLWFGFDDGQIAVLENNQFRLIPLDDEQKSAINGFAEDAKGNIIAATQSKGLLRISANNIAEHLLSGIEGQLISSINLSSDDKILLGTFDGLFLFRFQSNEPGLELIGRVEDIPYTNVPSIVKMEGQDGFFIGTEDEGLYEMEIKAQNIQSYSIKKLGLEFDLDYVDVKDIFRDDLKNLWFSTGGEGVYRLNYSKQNGQYSSLSHYTEKNGLVSNYMQAIFQDKESNIWMGSYGAGISVLKDQAFSFYDVSSENFSSNILSLLKVGDNYWIGSETGILITDLSGNKEEVLGVKNGLPNDGITSLYQDSRGVIWIGTSRNGIYKAMPGDYRITSFYKSLNSLENTVSRIIGKDNEVWAATNGGVINFNIASGRSQIFSTKERLPHNRIRDIYLDKKDQVWIATRSNGIYNLIKKEGIDIDVKTELEFVSITEDKQGIKWAVTDGEGVFGFSKDSLIHLSSADGLRSNYCYSIAEDSEGNLWVGHRLGISRINKDRNNIKIYSIEQGINADFNHNAILKNEFGQLVFGTSKGLVFYDPSSDKKDSIPPKLNITSLKISDVDYDFTKDIYLPYGRYKIRIDFRGINLKNPEDVSYQYKLDGYDDWSEPGNQSFVIYSRIEDGRYRFMLKACDESGLCTEEPLELIIEVKIPVWKAWWFISALIFSLMAGVYTIIKFRERKQRQLQEYLQTSLDERTKEVRKQASEIEDKNRDITDSINYAQRIQASILPPIGRLQNTFSGSFVFYQPRDIVSGDFYWYDTVLSNKFVIVCADSTGHGVPGAFMSMIGTTLIKDICSRSQITSPSDILATLDQEIQDALNQNVEAEKSNDGMDIIVAEIDLKTNYLRVASAMRPIILYLNGEQVYVKGSRNSVGGRFDEESDDKTFENEGFQLSKGDQVYMFSDGYPDQFGGPLGKKFKMVRLKNLLRDIHEKPMDEQYNYIKSNFMLWKEDLEQVDDVLFMGIRI